MKFLDAVASSYVNFFSLNSKIQNLKKNQKIALNGQWSPYCGTWLCVVSNGEINLYGRNPWLQVLAERNSE